jgi:hypothetical protein
MHIAGKPSTRRQVVFELHQPVINHFRARTPSPPAALEISSVTSSSCCRRLRSRA